MTINERARNISPAEFQHAVETKHARDMTDAEFEEASRQKIWRKTPAAGTRAQTDAPAAGGTSHGASRPEPAPATGHGNSYAATMAMTDEEFGEAIRKKAWRTGISTR
jgi:hypothetical protein